MDLFEIQNRMTRQGCWNGCRWLRQEHTLGIEARTRWGAVRTGKVHSMEEGWTWMKGFGCGLEAGGHIVDEGDRNEGARDK